MKLIDKIRDLNDNFTKAMDFYDKSLIDMKIAARDGKFNFIASAVMKDAKAKLIIDKLVINGFEVSIEPDLSGNLCSETILKIRWDNPKPQSIAYSLYEEASKKKNFDKKKLEIASILEDRFSKTANKFIILESSFIDDDTLQVLRSEGFYVEPVKNNSYKISLYK